MSNFLQVSLPVQEAIAAWAAAASTANALLPNEVKKCLTYENWEGGRIPDNDKDEDNVWDAFRITEACVAACRNLYEEWDSSFPLPRGMDIRILLDGCVYLIWESDSHIVTLKFVAMRSRWTIRDDEGKALESPGFEAILDITGDDDLETSPRVAAAVAASPTLQSQGWD